MNKKEVIISAKLDSSDFDRSIKTMKDKLSQITAPAEMSQQILQTRTRMSEMGMGRPPTEAERRRADAETKNAMRDTEKFIKEQVQQQDKLIKAYDTRIKQLKELKKLEEDNLKTGKEDLQLKERITRHETSISRLRQAAMEKDSTINRAADVVAAGGGGGGKGPGGIRGFINQMGGLPNILGGIGTGILTAVQAGRFYNDMPLVEAQGRAAMSGMGSSLMGAAASGRLGTETMFNPERMKALEEAQRFARLNRVLSVGQLAGGLAAGAGGIMAGAASGAALGSIVPGIGTAVGGIAGGIGGAYMGLRAAGGMEGMAQGLGAMGVPGLSSYFEARQGAQIAERFRAMEEAEKAQSPLKKLTTEFYQQRYRQDLGFQRSIGIGDEELRGEQGLIRRGAQAGFIDQDIMGAASNILAAGGSTRTARESAITANQLSRNFDLTNASQVLGMVGGRLGGGTQSDNAVIRLLAEGTKLGLDKSEFVQENRQFVQAAASIAANAGVRSAEGFQQVGSQLGAFMTDPTTGGIRSATTAYQRFEQLSGEGSGPAREAMRINAMAQSNPGFQKLLSEDRMVAFDIANMSMSEFTPDNPVVKSAMAQSGMSFEELKKSKTQAAVSGVDMTGMLDKKMSGLQNILKENPKMTMQQLAQLPEFGSAVATARQVGVASGMSATDTTSLLAGMMNLPESQMADFQKEAAKAMGKADTTGRVGDITAAGDAAGLAAMSESVNKMTGEFKDAGEAASKMTSAFLEAMTRFQEAIRSGDNNAIMQAFGGMQQTQSGASK